MKVFTVSGRDSTPGAIVSKLPNYNNEVEAVIVGSNENGCRLGILKLIEQVGIQNKIYHAEILGSSVYSKAEKGLKYSIKAQRSSKDDSKALLVLKTPVHKGGRNFHTGDRRNCVCYQCEIEFDILLDTCKQCGRKLKIYYQEFPLSILTSGTIRDSKKPVFGDQYICIVKKNQVFRTAYNGFVYGSSGCYYHWFDGNKVICATWEERKRMNLI